MIHRNAILSLRNDINRGCEVVIELSTGTAILIDEIIGVQDESHAIVDCGGNRVLLSLEHIAGLSIKEPHEHDADVEVLAD